MARPDKLRTLGALAIGLSLWFGIDAGVTLDPHAGSLLVPIPSRKAELRVEARLLHDAAALTTSVDRSVDLVADAFGRTFTGHPRIFLFATASSFSAGTRDLFRLSGRHRHYGCDDVRRDV
jgi:hypothetical protein